MYLHLFFFFFRPGNPYEEFHFSPKESEQGGGVFDFEISVRWAFIQRWKNSRNLENGIRNRRKVESLLVYSAALIGKTTQLCHRFYEIPQSRVEYFTESSSFRTFIECFSAS
ncbi:hypothetical protein NPIL_612721 [Nephila pilipes]|uniref:Uncharacterized protein n=1 Tax=Nephila pilipes TaxID=299642 RepID=A0A8X6QTY4_NEPPI|nr:hypothetical protein NPIL_612721 [Nephila pilipes]